MGLLSLIARLSMDTSDFNTKLKGAERTAQASGSKMGRSLAQGFGRFFTAGFGIGVAKSIANSASEVDKLDERLKELGVTIGEANVNEIRSFGEEWDKSIGKATAALAIFGAAFLRVMNIGSEFKQLILETGASNLAKFSKLAGFSQPVQKGTAALASMLDSRNAIEPTGPLPNKAFMDANKRAREQELKDREELIKIEEKTLELKDQNAIKGMSEGAQFEELSKRRDAILGFIGPRTKLESAQAELEAETLLGKMTGMSSPFKWSEESKRTIKVGGQDSLAAVGGFTARAGYTDTKYLERIARASEATAKSTQGLF